MVECFKNSKGGKFEVNNLEESLKIISSCVYACNHSFLSMKSAKTDADVIRWKYLKQILPNFFVYWVKSWKQYILSFIFLFQLQASFCISRQSHLLSFHFLLLTSCVEWWNSTSHSVLPKRRYINKLFVRVRIEFTIITFTIKPCLTVSHRPLRILY